MPCLFCCWSACYGLFLKFPQPLQAAYQFWTRQSRVVRNNNNKHNNNGRSKNTGKPQHTASANSAVCLSVKRTQLRRSCTAATNSPPSKFMPFGFVSYCCFLLRLLLLLISFIAVAVVVIVVAGFCCLPVHKITISRVSVCVCNRDCRIVCLSPRCWPLDLTAATVGGKSMSLKLILFLHFYVNKL